MDNTIRVFSGREFNPADIELIKWTRRSFPKLSRAELSQTICELLDWLTPAGKSKINPCTEFLELLETEGVLKLPIKQKRGQEKGKILPDLQLNEDKIEGEIGEYSPIRLEIATVGEARKKWRAYVEQYHMLGDKSVIGSQLHYFIKSGDLELGCVLFSASSWALMERDRWIGWNVADRKRRLHLIINNSRFLIFPWVHIPNLASKILSLAAKQIQEDWLREYCYAPVLLETFVDTEHFKGTCYKAANWLYLGETKGRGRMDREREYALSRKAIFMYPLQKDFKECLRGEKPHKVVNPDEQ